MINNNSFNSRSFVKRAAILEKDYTFPKFIVFLFFVFSIYLVVPIVDVPFLGLSISAPIFFFISIYCILKTPKSWLMVYRYWIIMAILIWAGIFLSATLNGLFSGGLNINSEGIKTVIRYAYWLLVFIITMYVSSYRNILIKVTELLGWGVLFLALLRWIEIYLFQNIGAWSGTKFLPQNAYGMLFSTFSPFLLVNTIRFKGLKRSLSILGFLILISAMIINGSRSSWVAVGLGILLFLSLLYSTHKRKVISILFMLILTSGIIMTIFSFIPVISESFITRAFTFETLENDKSFVMRQLMNQKSIRIFENSPIIGVGSSRFRLTNVELIVPGLLGYLDQSYINRISSHNSYLGFLAETGLIGSFPLLILLCVLLINGYKHVNEFLNNKQIWALGIYVSYIQMSIHMWSFSSFTSSSTWFIYGLLGALIMKSKLKQFKE